VMTSDESKRNDCASRLRWARENAGLSQGQAAKMLGFHRPTISQIEAGQRAVKVEELNKFAELYDVKEDWLLSGDVSFSKDPTIELAARELSKLKKDDLEKILKLIQAVRTRRDKRDE